ncbi:hypothetical protein ABVK25_007713 [Lepraria finkii]|uniref:Uncharacterized protein n=1 Tax=Lepraria finkii TaxID=1340010 RepID=A0ABR4B546_9LECA
MPFRPIRRDGSLVHQTRALKLNRRTAVHYAAATENKLLGNKPKEYLKKAMELRTLKLLFEDIAPCMHVEESACEVLKEGAEDYVVDLFSTSSVQRPASSVLAEKAHRLGLQPGNVRKVYAWV